jgi:hypothetical protein
MNYLHLQLDHKDKHFLSCPTTCPSPHARVSQKIEIWFGTVKQFLSGVGLGHILLISVVRRYTR